jgi:hypothetical protein
MKTRIIAAVTLTTMLFAGCAYNQGFDPNGYRRTIALGGTYGGGVAKFHQRHPQAIYGLALTIGEGALQDYWSLDITALDIATYIVVHDRTIPWNVALTVGDYLESWIGIAKLANDQLPAEEILSDGVKWGLTGIPPLDLREVRK